MGGLLFNACTPTEPASTITLNAFGPSAALRGGELKFIGTNMDKVTAVDLPGTAEITTFVSKSSTEIVIAIPQDAMPGLVVLKTPQGDITTKTPLTFTEPILISTYAPATVKAGDVLTINGDYLNLIAQVIFSNGVAVDSAHFVAHSQTRKQIQVVVPITAQTGKVALSNGAAIPVLVYTANDLVVTLPTITALSPNPAKSGSNLTITGTDFQLVKSVVFTDGLTVTGADLTVNTAKTTITVKVPATAKDGKVKLVAQSGVEVVSSTDLTLVVPVITSVAPNPVKNGSTLTVTGTNLDLVTGASFNGVAGTLGTLSSDNTTLALSVPLTATNGTIVLSTNSGKTATTAAVTYVLPTISSFTPTQLMAGGDITITGTNLDIVTKVVFIGDLTVDVTPSSAISLVVTVPPSCVGTDVVKLVTSNGSQVSSTGTLIVDAANKPVITGITASVKPGKMMTITGTKLNLVESIYFQTGVKAIMYGVRTETSIEVYVPDGAKKGAVTLTMNAFDGSAIVSPVFTISGTDPVTDPTLVLWNFDSGLTATGGTWNGVGGLGDPSDAVSGAYYEIKASNWNKGYWWFAENYITHPSVPKTGYVVKMDIRLRTDIPALNDEVRLLLSGQALNILPYLKVGNVWTTGGDWKTISIPLTAWTGLADPTPAKGGDWGIATWINTSNFTGFCIDNIRYEQSSGPSGVMRLY